MNENAIMWLVVIALGTIISLFVTVGKPIIKLNQTLTKLLSRMEFIENGFDEFKEQYHKDTEKSEEKKRESHKRIHDRIDRVEDEVGDLHRRVDVLEKT